MTDPVYERYKDALRRGHVAALRGRLDAALAAYGEAAEIAPERSLPQASLGRVLVRMGRLDEALAAFGSAIDKSPVDETALAGRAEVLATQGRRIDAADALDRLAEVQERAGRVAEACDSARQALELAESRPRRRLVERLVERLRDEPSDDAAAAVLERTISVLEPPVGGPEEVPGTGPGGAPRPGEAPDVADPSDLVATGEALLQSGDVDGAGERLLAGAIAHRAAGHIDAALDACYLALGIAPAAPDLHLTLAELYLERGWRGPAAEKLLLLGRLAELTGDEETRSRICGIVSAELREDERLTAYCA